MATNSQYRILSLDGGGSWSIIQAMALSELFGMHARGHEVLRFFDLAIANSGGSVVLALMVENQTISEIIGHYLNDKTRMAAFRPSKKFISILRRYVFKKQGVGPRYDVEAKYQALKKSFSRFGDVPIHELPALLKDPDFPDLIITAFKYNNERATFFRSRVKSSTSAVNKTAQTDIKTPTLTQAVHASTNAPVNYFDGPAKVTFPGEKFQRYFWDGAVGGFNNPIFAAYIEAITNNPGLKAEDFRILSIGSGNTKLPVITTAKTANDRLVKKRQVEGFLGDIRKMAQAIIADPPDTASFNTYASLYRDLPMVHPNFIRLSPFCVPDFRNGRWDYPVWVDSYLRGKKGFLDLLKLDMDAVQNEEIKLVEAFCRAWLQNEARNQPIRYDDELKLIIGHSDFASAKADFEKWTIMPHAPLA